MTYEDFLEQARNQGYEEKNDLIWGAIRARTSYEVEYNDEERPSQIVETEDEIEGSNEVSFNLEGVPVDSDFHFEARIIGSVESDEFVLIDEEGPYHGHVFINLHDEGLSTVEDLIDADEFDPSTLTAVYSDADYEDVDARTRLEWQPFFQNPVARSLEEFAQLLTAPQ